RPPRRGVTAVRSGCGPTGRQTPARVRDHRTDAVAITEAHPRPWVFTGSPMLHAMIMAGGGGTRFWPRSRQVRPKQFHCFSGDRTWLQGTVERIAAQVPPERTWVLTSAQHRAEAVAQLKGMVPPEQVIGEPEGRDTAPCVGLGAALVGRADP